MAWYTDLLGSTLSTFKVGKGKFDGNLLTAQRTLTLPDKSGTLAMVGDVSTSAHIQGNTALYVNQLYTYTITDFDSFVTYSFSVTAGSVSYASGIVSFTAPATAQTVVMTLTSDGYNRTVNLIISANGVEQPTAISPSNGATNQNANVTLTASAFVYIGAVDTHASSDWQVATDAGFINIVQSSTGDTVNKTSWQATGLTSNTTCYWRVRYTGAANGTSAYSSTFSFQTAVVFADMIGIQGSVGFGVGIYSGTLPSGFSDIAGNNTPSNANYGNYQYTDGSIMCFVPTFFYRIGNAASPRFATYGANAIDVVGLDTFANETAANTGGYAMHRAFWDGNSTKSGFFVDKYLCSKNGVTSGKSVANGVPISLTTTAGYTVSSGMTGCTGITADAIVLASARGTGFACESVFINSAIGLLSLAHAQASSSTTNNAWYNASFNFPKGCNSGTLSDTNDGTLTFTTAGDSGNANKPLTGSGSSLAKTTHNGQACGVADVNGSMWEVLLGLTSPGTSASSSASIGSGDAYTLKKSVAVSSLTAGWNASTDACGDSTHIPVLYDLQVGLLPWGAGTAGVFFGNGANQVFNGATSGISYARTSCAVPDTTSGYGGTGTAQFGTDILYENNIHNMMVLGCGRWMEVSQSGVWYKHFGINRTFANVGTGFRACYYGA